MSVTTVAQVRGWLKLPATVLDDDDHLVTATAAANRCVARYVTPAELADDTAGDLALAATMLAARLYRRRNSPEGVQAMTDAGAVYVARSDPDIARLLRIDQYTVPQVG